LALKTKLIKYYHMLPKAFLDILVVILAIFFAIITYVITKLFFASVYSGMLYLLFAIIISGIILLVILIQEYLYHKKHKYRESK